MDWLQSWLTVSPEVEIDSKPAVSKSETEEEEFLGAVKIPKPEIIKEIIQPQIMETRPIQIIKTKPVQIIAKSGFDDDSLVPIIRPATNIENLGGSKVRN